MTTPDPLALVGLLGLLFIKECGLPVPVPGDLLVIGAGVATSGDPPLALFVLVAILVAGYAGGIVQFLLASGALRRLLLGLLVRVGVPLARLESLAVSLRRRGARGVAVARVTPGLRVGAIAAAGLAALRLPTFAGGLAAGNILFVGGHFALGYLIGPAAIGLVAGGGSVALAIALLVALAVIGAVGWSALRRRRAASTVTGEPTAGGVFAAWADATCPACLALALVASDRMGGPLT